MKEERVTLRYAEAERRWIKKKAKAAGVAEGQWIRYRSLVGYGKLPDDLEEVAEDIRKAS